MSRVFKEACSCFPVPISCVERQPRTGVSQDPSSGKPTTFVSPSAWYGLNNGIVIVVRVVEAKASAVGLNNWLLSSGLLTAKLAIRSRVSLSLSLGNFTLTIRLNIGNLTIRPHRGSFTVKLFVILESDVIPVRLFLAWETSWTGEFWEGIGNS